MGRSKIYADESAKTAAKNLDNRLYRLSKKFSSRIEALGPVADEQLLIAIDYINSTSLQVALFIVLNVLLRLPVFCQLARNKLPVY